MYVHCTTHSGMSKCINPGAQTTSPEAQHIYGQHATIYFKMSLGDSDIYALILIYKIRQFNFMKLTGLFQRKHLALGLI